MNIFNFIKKKYIRLQGSKNILKFNYFVEKNFRDEKLGNIGFNFSNKPTRQFIVQNIINSKNFESYLEIGTFHDDLFKHIKCNKKVGVDPISGGTVRKTSDQFFNDNKDKFDCIFIDGLHYYSQVKKDIENSIKILNPNGIILLHDCLPNNHFEQAVPRCQWTWNGDVWKAIVECRIKENIDTYTCYADFGVGVIFKRKNKNLLKLNRQSFSKLKFKDYFFKHEEFMNIIEYEDLMKII
jgi:SAM-dependent methyltransferase